MATHVRVDWVGLGPYDAIHVGAAAPTLPSELVDQLASPGRMFIPVGTFMQYIEQVDKDEQGKVTSKRIMGVSVSVQAKELAVEQLIHCRKYVPLTDKSRQSTF